MIIGSQSEPDDMVSRQDKTARYFAPFALNYLIGGRRVLDHLARRAHDVQVTVSGQTGGAGAIERQGDAARISARRDDEIVLQPRSTPVPGHIDAGIGGVSQHTIV